MGSWPKLARKSCESTTQPGEHEREHQPRPSIVSAQSGEYEDAGANDRSDAQRRQLEYSQRAFQAMRANEHEPGQVYCGL